MPYEGFENRTPFCAQQFLLADENGATVLTLVAKATYDLQRGGGLALAAEQAGLHLAPEHHGEPGKSSLRYESEVAFAKPVVDVVLLGHARPDRGRKAEVDVSLRVGPVKKQVRVFGDRFWRRKLGGRPAMSEPASFEAMPLVYERAFGGNDRWSGAQNAEACDLRNPVGVGFVAKPPDPSVAFADDDIKLPNLEYPAQLVRELGDRPQPAGFGFLAPDWTPRRQLAGTYDEAWKANRFPRLPTDFSRRHFNAAPADQQLRALRGGEPVEVTNVSVRGPLAFELPRVAISATVKLRGAGLVTEPMKLDTLVIDADAHRVHVVLRASFGVHRKVHDIEWSRVVVDSGGGDARGS
jgi:hypothetical protein